jgi:hypothetical protein
MFEKKGKCCGATALMICRSENLNADALSKDEADPTSWQVESNVKLVMIVDRPLADLRAELTAKGVRMGKIKSYPPLTGQLCDGRDPEGNIFQLAEATSIATVVDTSPRPA